MLSREAFRRAMHLRASRTVASRATGSSAASADFSGEIVELYATLFEQHYHPHGPWAKIVKEAEARVPAQGGKILDLASGPGEPACLLASAIPGASVISSDFSQDMVDKATQRSKDLDNVRCLHADAQDLSRFPTGTFDVVTCCYGYMFCPDPLQAMRESHRVLKPGGTLLATYWTELAAMRACRTVMAAVAPGAPPKPPPINPMALAEAGLVDSMLRLCGFDEVRISPDPPSSPPDLRRPGALL